MRLIDADMLCKYCNNNINHSITPNEIMRMSFIDAEPVRHGRWETGTFYRRCTACGAEFVDETPYCPNCGAKMDGKSE